MRTTPFTSASAHGVNNKFIWMILMFLELRATRKADDRRNSIQILVNKNLGMLRERADHQTLLVLLFSSTIQNNDNLRLRDAAGPELVCDSG